jgi:hypothetical protein
VATEVSIFDKPSEFPEELLQAARERGFPQDVIDRARELKVNKGIVDWWVKHDRPTPDEARKYLAAREKMMYGTMSARLATWNDDEALADLYANAPEEIGDWEVTVERSPYPFAQFRLQEHVSISVLEDRGVILAATADSSRNALVGGERTGVHIASAWRVRKEFRGQGLSRLLRMAEGPAVGWFGTYNYYYIRSGNFGALGWIKAFIPESVNAPAREGDVPGIPITVHHFDAAPEDGHPRNIRLANRSDLRRCVALNNRTHRGQDMFRPYSTEYLEQRLDDPFWGEKPDFWVPVYGWPEYCVVEDEGRIVACGGLWDKGKNVREVWRHKETGEIRSFDSTALLDFGYAEGREDTMTRLIQHFIGLTHGLGRSYLAAPLEQLPKLAERVEKLEPTTETRALHFQSYSREKDEWFMHQSLNRPYTDLAYW